jgi:hypothetical protein
MVYRVILTAALSVALVTCGAPEPAVEPTPIPMIIPTDVSSAPVEYGTINNSDGVGGTLDPINVWNDYHARTAVVARLHGGDWVQIIERSGRGVHIRTAAGVEGWLSTEFVNVSK